MSAFDFPLRSANDLNNRALTPYADELVVALKNLLGQQKAQLCSPMLHFAGFLRVHSSAAIRCDTMSHVVSRPVHFGGSE
jgi:hypothetical protein